MTNPVPFYISSSFSLRGTGLNPRPLRDYNVITLSCHDLRPQGFGFHPRPLRGGFNDNDNNHKEVKP